MWTRVCPQQAPPGGKLPQGALEKGHGGFVVHPSRTPRQGREGGCLAGVGESA